MAKKYISKIRIASNPLRSAESDPNVIRKVSVSSDATVRDILATILSKDDSTNKGRIWIEVKGSQVGSYRTSYSNGELDNPFTTADTGMQIDDSLLDLSVKRVEDTQRGDFLNYTIYIEA